MEAPVSHQIAVNDEVSHNLIGAVAVGVGMQGDGEIVETVGCDAFGRQKAGGADEWCVDGLGRIGPDGRRGGDVDDGSGTGWEIRLEFAGATGERGGIDTGGDGGSLIGGEAGVRWWGRVGTVRRERDDAADLMGGVTKRNTLEGTADV